MAGFTVTATRLYVRQEDGSDKLYYRGDAVSGLSAEDVERFTKAGAIAEGGDEAAAAKASPTNPEETGELEVSEPLPTGITRPQASEILPDRNSATAATRPARAATVDAWRDYAVDSGQLSREEADKLGKDAIRERVR